MGGMSPHDISATFQRLKMIERDQETGRFKIVRPLDLITKHKEKEANSNRHRIDDSKLKWTPLGPEIINEEMQSDDADDEEDEQLAKVIEESKRETMETPKTTATEKKKRKKGMKGDYDWGARKKRKTNNTSNTSSPAPSVKNDEYESDNEMSLDEDSRQGDPSFEPVATDTPRRSSLRRLS